MKLKHKAGITKPLTLVTLTLCVMLTACADEKVEPLRSPCAGIDGSPCGPKRPVNDKSRQSVEIIPTFYVVTA